ncbi:hypothetical protein F383_21296 [Gossypium arboreum]|uniref:Uncharacterized protein n=1 Tax=Gossypium arboreum TaxID=29729 RepID=A0A0B0NY31_GOSAR|nr:hypothetical protein F383_21296 [Gossypium arboreum]
MTLSQTGSYTKSNMKSNMMPTSQPFMTYRILCHDICILTIPKVRMGLRDVRTL